MIMIKVSFDTLLGGYSVYRLHTSKHGFKVWARLSNHPTYDAAKAAELALRSAP
jgi:hypothetical protein